MVLYHHQHSFQIIVAKPFWGISQQQDQSSHQPVPQTPKDKTQFQTPQNNNLPRLARRLALMHANGSRIVCLVVPPALISLSRSVLQNLGPNEKVTDVTWVICWVTGVLV